MGIYKSYDEKLGKWKWKGFMFVRYYDTESQADADKENVWKTHIRKLEATRFISEMLIKCRANIRTLPLN